MNNTIQINKHMNSATGTANHSPNTLNKIVKTTILMTVKTNVLNNDIRKDILPFERAVNSALEKILNPHKRYEKVKIIYPSEAIK